MDIRCIEIGPLRAGPCGAASPDTYIRPQPIRTISPEDGSPLAGRFSFQSRFGERCPKRPDVRIRPEAVRQGLALTVTLIRKILLHFRWEFRRPDELICAACQPELREDDRDQA